MEKQRRVIKTLSLLAASMTSVTMLLMWLESKQHTPMGLDPINEHSAVEEAVGQAEHPAVSWWEGIRVTVLSGEPPADLTATGSAGGEAVAEAEELNGYHFEIRESGEVVCSPVWRQQRKAEGRREICVLVLGSSPGLELSQMQSISLKLLVNKLQELIAEGQNQPLYWERTLAERSDHHAVLCWSPQTPDTPEQALN